ncbi:hypothetical protein [uncultured Thiohalocapsa sp.]|uniref:hypothetical protein n=1 Tax=uncultured Thiohalocapsa sp. TaxID=768990 RepID=UPI0025D594D7|nr:hypothetical protein [uncultured Thiohalocapsa sp.]
MQQVRIISKGPRLLPQPKPRPLRTTQPLRPLTHHDILALMAPFTRRGLHADMAASRREARVLAFRPQPIPASADCPVDLTAQLSLEAAQVGKHRLVRRVWDASGLTATLTADGADLDALLGQLDQVPVRRHFAVYDGVPVARSYVLEPASQALSQRAGAGARWAAQTVGGRLWRATRGGAERLLGARLPWLRRKAPASVPATPAVPEPGAAPADQALIADADGPLRAVLTEANTRVGPLHLNLKADRFNGMPVELKLTTDAGATLKLPQDLLAVIGWHYRPLRQIISYWRGSIRVATHEPERTADIEAKLGAMVRHLSATLALSPQEFHRRHQAARWRVTYQRAVPMLFLLGIMAATPGIQWLNMADNSLLRMLIFHAPPFMLVGFFLMREMPRFEIPPLPRALVQRDWVERVSDKPAPTTAPAAAADARRPDRGFEQPAGAQAEG